MSTVNEGLSNEFQILIDRGKKLRDVKEDPELALIEFKFARERAKEEGNLVKETVALVQTALAYNHLDMLTAAEDYLKAALNVLDSLDKSQKEKNDGCE